MHKIIALVLLINFLVKVESQIITGGSVGKVNVESISEDVRNLTNLGVHFWNQQNKHEMYYRLKSITNATSQVVAGVTYKLHVILQETECKKSSMILDSISNADIPKLFSSCKPTNKKQIGCFIKIWSKPWMNFVDLVDPEEVDQPAECNLPSYNLNRSDSSEK
jgi:hypothetical protein